MARNSTWSWDDVDGRTSAPAKGEAAAEPIRPGKASPTRKGRGSKAARLERIGETQPGAIAKPLTIGEADTHRTETAPAYAERINATRRLADEIGCSFGCAAYIMALEARIAALEGRSTA